MSKWNAQHTDVFDAVPMKSNARKEHTCEDDNKIKCAERSTKFVTNMEPQLLRQGEEEDQTER